MPKYAQAGITNAPHDSTQCVQSGIDSAEKNTFDDLSYAHGWISDVRDCAYGGFDDWREPCAAEELGKIQDHAIGQWGDVRDRAVDRYGCTREHD